MKHTSISRPSQPLRIFSLEECGPVPVEFPALIGWASDLGDAFAAAYCVLSQEQLLKEMLLRETRIAGKAGRNLAVRRALEGIFNFASVANNLSSKEDGLDDGRLRAALSAAARSQRCLMQAFMSLPPGAAETLFDARMFCGVDPEEWRKTCVGAMAAARIARLLCLKRVPCSYPHVDLDVYNKIDLLCGPFPGGKGFCLQIKSSRSTKSSLQELTEKPVGGDRKKNEARSFWRGQAFFNREFDKEWTPVMVQVGWGEGVLTDVRDCPKLETAITEFIVRNRLTK